MLLFNRSANINLPNQPGFWGRFKPKNKEPDLRQQAAQMSLETQRLLTLVFGEQESIHKLPQTYFDLEALARDWAKPPPGAEFFLRVPIEYASVHAASPDCISTFVLTSERLDINADIVQLAGDDSYQIAIKGVYGLRVEIVTDAPPPPDEPPPPPPPPVLDMPATFSLELEPGQTVALDVSVVSDELDMARMDDGTIVDGQFWGKLDIVHQGDNHKLNFSGTRMPPGEEYSADIMFDSKIISKLAIASKPPVAKCQLSVICPASQYCDITLQTSPYWKLSMIWPPAEAVQGDPNRVKLFFQSHPGGAMEHYTSETVTTAFYYEATPDVSMIDTNSFINSRNGFAMPFRDFLLHLKNVLDQLGLSIHARTNFINNNIASWSLHRNIAYRFLTPAKIAAAIDITVHVNPCTFTRLFLIWRGLNDEDVSADFDGAGEKEANVFNWREIIGWSEHMKDPNLFRILELSVMDIT
ncbi:hypothetical protein AGABI2DRAFT_63607 [Agaricus bisporus var. bisporus H97]|uniref:hypothetical protein n=1 Tax=Agaricus bisporus var. bisporus (strain H97 / ATCC MYA-4626 / FGSC 10389) TaxID=936046 RepID=UPI00029F5B36|nr:hypothetical protein AGABI2DRAFT_63607 [Agaricus bisporus var. bisporus H97]EKV50038.1 hypothetical protein AGABI2DRAFT_63607 [Agaricus bisporus var. bisporus H97]